VEAPALHHFPHAGERSREYARTVIVRVVITGAAGRIGTQIVEELSSSHELCLLDRRPVSGPESVVADLAQPNTAKRLRRWFRSKRTGWMETFAGAETVIHLVTHPRHLAPWGELLPDNVQATWNVFEAAVQHRVPRVVFASSNWVVKALERELAPLCYRPDGPKIGSDVPPRPITAYGVTKALGEIAGRRLVDEGQLSSFVAVRIGSYHADPPTDDEVRHRWIGPRDIRSLFGCCVEVPFEGFHVVYGVSAQPTAPYDLSHTRRLLSWEPQQLP
jgi:uronate dehydrogenase